MARTQTALESFLSYNLHFLFLSEIKVVGRMLIRNLLWVGVLCFCSHLNLLAQQGAPRSWGPQIQGSISAQISRHLCAESLLRCVGELALLRCFSDFFLDLPSPALLQSEVSSGLSQ